MEFPELDHHCKTCKQLDFLPFKCSFCDDIFCLEHKDPSAHECKDYNDPNTIEEPVNVTNYESKKCFRPRCQNRVYVQTCEKCNKNYCISHRFHDCLDTNIKTQPKLSIKTQKKQKRKRRNKKCCIF